MKWVKVDALDGAMKISAELELNELKISFYHFDA